LVELGLGRYAWASPWLRACALRALDPSSPTAIATLTRATADTNSLVAETAAAALLPSGSGDDGATPGVVMPTRYLTVEKVIVLRDVSLFKAIPHQILAGVVCEMVRCANAS